MRTPDLSPEAARELAAIDDALTGRAVEPELTELGELALALRDERPEMTADFARSLDAREWGARERRARVRRPWLGFAPAFAATVLLALVVSVAALNGSGEESAPTGGADGHALPQATLPEAADQGGEDAASQSARSAPPAPASGAGQNGSTFDLDAAKAPPALQADGRRARKIERSATMTLAARPRDVDSVADGVLRVTDSLGGFVRSSTVTSSREGGGGTFELRIPAARLNRALSELSKLARVRERSQSSQDITGSFVSAREQLEDAQAERRALLRALGRAVTVNETASIRARLRLVAQEIAGAKRSLARVASRASYSTVLVSLVGDRSLGSSAPGEEDDGVWSPGDALRDAARVLEVAAGVIVVGLAVLLPFGLVALAGWAAGRQLRRRRRERALDAV